MGRPGDCVRGHRRYTRSEEVRKNVSLVETRIGVGEGPEFAIWAVLSPALSLRLFEKESRKALQLSAYRCGSSASRGVGGQGNALPIREGRCVCSLYDMICLSSLVQWT